MPGNPADGFEHPELEMAATTWTGEWWRMGGGGTAWDGMAYDPRPIRPPLDLLVGRPGAPGVRLRDIEGEPDECLQ